MRNDAEGAAGTAVMSAAEEPNEGDGPGTDDDWDDCDAESAAGADGVLTRGGGNADLRRTTGAGAQGDVGNDECLTPPERSTEGTEDPASEKHERELEIDATGRDAAGAASCRSDSLEIGSSRRRFGAGTSVSVLIPGNTR